MQNDKSQPSKPDAFDRESFLFDLKKASKIGSYEVVFANEGYLMAALSQGHRWGYGSIRPASSNRVYKYYSQDNAPDISSRREALAALAASSALVKRPSQIFFPFTVNSAPQSPVCLQNQTPLCPDVLFLKSIGRCCLFS